jgi:endoglucanase
MNYTRSPFNLIKAYLSFLFLALILTTCDTGRNIYGANEANRKNTEKIPQVDGKPELINLGMASADKMVLRIRAKSVIHGKQIPYVPQPGDEIKMNQQHRTLIRDGKAQGNIAGINKDILYTKDSVVGEELNIEKISEPESFIITPASSKEQILVKKVFRKSKPVDCTRGPGTRDFPMDHYIILDLDQKLQDGDTYKVQVKEGILSETLYELKFNSKSTFTEAIHINQSGFRPDDPVKLAFLSFWMGDGGGLDYADTENFKLIHAGSGKKAYEGEIRLSKKAEDPTNISRTSIYSMDFSDFSRPGLYKVSIEGIGCSFPFEIGDDTWKNAFIKSMRGLFCQRNGIELGPPYTDFIRPRGFHPDDGVKVYVSEKGYKATGSVPAEIPELEFVPTRWFGPLYDNITPQVLPYAWGGYMDAGDWDRRPDHALMPLMMFDLEEMAHPVFSQWEFNIIESGDEIPDLINEALWLVDFLKRMQQEDGSVFSGIESAQHPRMGECSWQESLPVMAYARNRNSAYNYVAVGSRAAFWFKNHGYPEKSKEYFESVLRAFDWAEDTSNPDKDPGQTSNARCLAAAELFRLTGEEKYHSLFLSLTRFKDPASPFYTSFSGPTRDEQGQAAWTYLITERDNLDPEIKSNISEALIRDAKIMVQNCMQNDFRWARGHDTLIRWGALSMPESHLLCRAHYITGKEEYLQAVIMSALSGTGANQVNMSFVTGVGARWPQHPLHEDAYLTHQDLYEGVTVGGPIDPARGGRKTNAQHVEPLLYPDPYEWPVTESYFDVFLYVPMNEFTVHQTMMATSFVWGYLAARP